MTRAPDPGPAIAAIEAALREDPRAPISKASVGAAHRVHIRDSLGGVEVDELAGAGRIGDIGSGAGLPGLVLAAALPDARVDLIESAGRKCEFIRATIERAGLANAEVVQERAERWGAAEGREAYDAVTVRAVGRLSTVAELASPLLELGGFLVAWEGRRDREQEAELGRALPLLAMELVEIRPVTPYEGSRDRHIHLLRKNGPTPKEIPRRDGLAAKRPFGSE